MMSTVVVDAIVRLVRRLEALLRDRLEAQEQRLATAPRRKCDELLVARGVGRALARPPFLERSEGPEELLRVTRIRADVVVPEHDRARRARRDLADDFVDRTVAHRPRTVEERDRTVVAAVGTPSRCDGDRLPVAASFDEVPARGRHAGERRLPRRDVDRLELPAARVVEDARPRVLGLAHDHCVGMARGLLGESRRVGSADHHGHAATTELAREAVGVESRGRRGGDRHEVRRHVEPHRLDDFVRVRNRVLGRRQRRDQRHGELRELDQTATAKASRLRRLGGDQVNAHESDGTESLYFFSRPVSFRNVWFSWQMNSIGSEPSVTICWRTLTVKGRVYAFGSSTVNSISSRP